MIIAIYRAPTFVWQQIRILENFEWEKEETKKANQGKSRWQIALGRLLHNGRGRQEGVEGRSKNKIKNGTKAMEELEKARANENSTTGDGAKEDRVTNENKTKEEAKKTKKKTKTSVCRVIYLTLLEWICRLAIWRMAAGLSVALERNGNDHFAAALTKWLSILNLNLNDNLHIIRNLSAWSN